MEQSNLAIEPEVLKAIYGQMARIRAVDKAIQAGLSAGKFMFTYWPMTGQECIPATISQLISKDDYMITTYRGIHDQVAKGVDLYGMFAEALGREDGVNKGKGGSPHISDPSSGSMVTTAAGAPPGRTTAESGCLPVPEGVRDVPRRPLIAVTSSWGSAGRTRYSDTPERIRSR